MIDATRYPLFYTGWGNLQQSETGVTLGIEWLRAQKPARESYNCADAFFSDW